MEADPKLKVNLLRTTHQFLHISATRINWSPLRTLQLIYVPKDSGHRSLSVSMCNMTLIQHIADSKNDLDTKISCVTSMLLIYVCNYIQAILNKEGCWMDKSCGSHINIFLGHIDRQVDRGNFCQTFCLVENYAHASDASNWWNSIRPPGHMTTIGLLHET